MERHPSSEHYQDFLRQEKQKITNAFSEIHTSRGFHQTPEVPPYPSPDETVLFVGAQISLWKPHLLSIQDGSLSPNFCAQNCIRLQNKEFFYNEEPLRFNSYFRTHGAVAPADSFTSMAEIAINFLKAIDTPEERILVKTNTNLGQNLPDNCNALVNSEPKDYYLWGYGDPSLKGAGITIAIKSERDESHHDIGNVILISKDDEPIVSEWGFGEETLLTALYSEKLPLLFTDLPADFYALLDKKDGAKYVDALVTSVRIAGLGVPAVERSAGAMLSEYIRGISFLGFKLEKNMKQILADVDKAVRYYDIPSNSVATIKDRVQFYRGRINYLRTQLNGIEGDSSLKNLARKIGLAADLAENVVRLTVMKG